jgi:hypothetical protein
MPFKGPQYLFCGSRLSEDRLILRAILDGLNTQGRQWNEIITIQDDGSLWNLENEVEDHKYLQLWRVHKWSDPNIVICFIDQLRQNRAAEQTMQTARANKRPVFVVSSYEGSPENIVR